MKLHANLTKWYMKEQIKMSILEHKILVIFYR